MINGTGSALYKTLTSAAAVDDGVFGVATLKNGSSEIVTTNNDIVLWAWAPGLSQPAIRLREGQTIALSESPLVSRTVKSFDVLTAKAGVVGQGRSFNNVPEVLVRVACTDGSIAFAKLSTDTDFLDTTEVVTAIIKGASPVPSSGPSEPAGATFTAIDTPASNALGHRAFKGVASGPAITSANDAMIWADNSGTSLALVAREGAAAPGTSGTFGSFMDPIISDDESVAFLATLKTAAGISSTNNQGVWAQTGEGLKLIARKGSTIEGVPTAAVINSFTTAVINDTGGAITGKLRTGVGGVSPNSDAFLAVWRDSDGVAAVVLREGMWLEVSPGHPRAIKSFDVFTPQAPFKGVGRSHNATGGIAVYCVFVDGTTGIFILEPAGGSGGGGLGGGGGGLGGGGLGGGGLGP